MTNPTPAELAAKSREETVTISLRMNERTNMFFNFVAKKYNTTPTAMLNGVLDNYSAENSDDEFEQYYLNRQAITTLRRQRAQIAKMTEEELEEASGWNDYEYWEDLNQTNTLENFFKYLDKGEEENYYGDMMHEIFGEADSRVFVYPNKVKDTRVYEYANLISGSETVGKLSEVEIRSFLTYLDGYSDAEGVRYIVEMPHRKWLVFSYIVNKFMDKYRLTHDGKQYNFTKVDLKKMAAAIDNNSLDDRDKLVAAIIDCLDEACSGVK